MLNKKLIASLLTILSLVSISLYAKHRYTVKNISDPGTPHIYVDFHGGGGTSHIEGSIAPGETKTVDTALCHSSITAQVRHTNTTSSLDIPFGDNRCSDKTFQVRLADENSDESGDTRSNTLRVTYEQPKIHYLKFPTNYTKLSDAEYEKAMRCKDVPDGGVCPSVEDLKKKEVENARFIAAGQQLFANAQKK